MTERGYPYPGTRRRYGVERCDEGGTLFRPDGTPIDHTWSVIDRATLIDDRPREVSNHDTREQARVEAAKMNTEGAS
jgi:hypothetical protein